MLIRFHYHVPNVTAALDHIRGEPAFPSHAERLQRDGVSERKWLRDRVTELFWRWHSELLAGEMAPTFRGLGCIFTPIHDSTGPSFVADLPITCTVTTVQISFYLYADSGASQDDPFALVDQHVAA